MKSGIYKITNLVNNKFYIGSAIDLVERKYEHFRKLKNNQHCNILLQNSFNKHGLDNFNFEIIANCPKEYLIKLEQFFIDTINPQYNICKVAGNKLGVKHKEESKQKLKRTLKEKYSNSSRKLNEQQVQEIKDLLGEGKKLKDIASKFNVSISVISKLKSKYKIDVYDNFNFRKADNKYEPFPKEYIQEMNNKLKLSGQTRYRFIKENNLPQSFWRLLNK